MAVKTSNSAAVYASLLKPTLEVGEKSTHLYEISKAPRGAWPALVEHLVAESWTVETAGFVVKRLRDLVTATKDLPAR